MIAMLQSAGHSKPRPKLPARTPRGSAPLPGRPSALHQARSLPTHAVSKTDNDALRKLQRRALISRIATSPKRTPGGCSGTEAKGRRCSNAPKQTLVRGGSTNPEAIELIWPADRNDSSTGCVLGIGTADNLAAGTYGGYSSEIVINWASAHGYSYSLFIYRHSLNKTEDKARLFWAKPQAMRRMLQRPACAWAMYLDGDAVINQPRFSVEEKLLRFLAPAVPAVRILLTCHSPFGDSDDCLPCKCCRAGHCPASARARPAPADGSIANAGVVLVRNDPTAREMIRWWANAGDGECDAHSYFGEQNCAGRMQRRWVNQIDVVSAAVMNAPFWYNPANWTNVTTIQEYHLAHRSVRIQSSEIIRAVKSNENRSRPALRTSSCFSSDLFICHAYAMQTALRDVAFRAHHATIVGPLRHLLSWRGRTYAERPAWTAWKRADAL